WLPSPAVAGVLYGYTVTAEDPYGNKANSYRGTIRFSSSDAQAVLRGDYTFTAADNGRHGFSGILKTAGSQTVTVTDISTATITMPLALAPAFIPAVTFRSIDRGVTVGSVNVHFSFTPSSK